MVSSHETMPAHSGENFPLENTVRLTYHPDRLVLATLLICSLLVFLPWR